jgi:hypothetical protein
MNQVSNEIAGVIYYAAVFVVSLLLAQVLGIIINPIISGLGITVLFSILSWVYTVVTVLVVAPFFKQYVGYSNGTAVVNVATVIFAVIVIVMTLSTMYLPNLVFVSVDIIIFYVLSKGQLA